MSSSSLNILALLENISGNIFCFFSLQSAVNPDGTLKTLFVNVVKSVQKPKENFVLELGEKEADVLQGTNV